MGVSLYHIQLKFHRLRITNSWRKNVGCQKSDHRSCELCTLWRHQLKSQTSQNGSRSKKRLRRMAKNWFQLCSPWVLPSDLNYQVPNPRILWFCGWFFCLRGACSADCKCLPQWHGMDWIDAVRCPRQLHIILCLWFCCMYFGFFQNSAGLQKMLMLRWMTTSGCGDLAFSNWS